MNRSERPRLNLQAFELIGFEISEAEANEVVEIKQILTRLISFLTSKNIDDANEYLGIFSKKEGPIGSVAGILKAVLEKIDDTEEGFKDITSTSVLKKINLLLQNL